MFQTELVEEIKTHFVFEKFFFENGAVYEIMRKNTAERGQPKMTIRHMLIACWITMTTHTHTHTHSLFLSLTHTHTHNV
jgi:hypothetical protein